jgi:ketosteroid isomerase-like protein
MSEENIEIAWRSYEHFIATGDVPPEVFDPEFILDMSKFRDWPERREYHGVQGFRDFLRDWLEPWDEYEFQLQELREVGDKVLVLARQAGSSHASGVRVEMEVAHVLTYHRGKNIRMEIYASPHDGLQAVGLRE